MSTDPNKFEHSNEGTLFDPAQLATDKFAKKATEIPTGAQQSESDMTGVIGGGSGEGYVDPLALDDDFEFGSGGVSSGTGAGGGSLSWTTSTIPGANPWPPDPQSQMQMQTQLGFGYTRRSSDPEYHTFSGFAPPSSHTHPPQHHDPRPSTTTRTISHPSREGDPPLSPPLKFFQHAPPGQTGIGLHWTHARQNYRRKS